MGRGRVISDFKPVRKVGNLLTDFTPISIASPAPAGDLIEPPPLDFDNVFDDLNFYRGEDPGGYKADVTASLAPVVRPFAAQGYNTLAAMNRGFATFMTHLDTISEYLSEKTGMEKSGILGPDFLKKVADHYNKDSDHWAQRARDEGINFIDELVSEAAGGAMPGIAEFLLNVPYSATLGAAEAYKKGESEIAGALVEGAKRGVLGSIFKAIAPMRKYLRAPLMAGTFAVQTAAEGGSAREIAKAAGTGGIYALTSPGGLLGLNELKKDLSKTLVKRLAEQPRIEPIVEAPATAPLEEDQKQPGGLVVEPEAAKMKRAEEIPLEIRKTTEDPRQQQILNQIRKSDPGEYKRILKGNTAELVRQWEEKRLGAARRMTEEALIEPPFTREGLFGRKKPKETENLVQWVRDQGGIWDPTLKGEVAQFAAKESGVVGLVSKKGKPFDEITQSSIESRWLPQGATSRDFLDLLRHDVSAAKFGGSRVAKEAGEYSPETIARLEKLYEGRLQFAPKAGFRREPEVDISPGEITGRADILRFLQDKLGTPIRTGRFREGAAALGIYKPFEDVIRTRNFADIEVIAHEVGHGMHKFLWPQTWAGMGEDAPLLPFKRELLELASGVNVPPGHSRLAEGFAEFIRLYMTNEPMASGLAPHFYGFFDGLLERKSPESREIFLQVRADYDRYMRQPAYQRVRSQVSIKEKAESGKTLGDRLHDLYTGILDEFHPLLVAEGKMTGGEKLPVGESPYGLARLFNGWIGKFNSWLKFSPFEFKTYKNVGKPLEEILKPVAEDLEGFSTYMVAKRVPGLAERGIDVGIRPEDAKEVITQKEREHPEFSKAFDQLQQYQDHLLTYLRDSGILADEIYTKIREVSKDYDPFYRVFEGEGQGAGGGLGKGFEAWQPVKEIRGGWQRIQDPVESIVKNTMLYVNLAERNAVGQALVKLAEKKEGLGKFVEEIPERRRMEVIKPEELFTPQGIAKMKEAGVELPEFYQVFRPAAFTPRENVIAVWVDGVQREYQVTPDIWRVIKSLDREGVNALEKLAAYPARWLRAGSVLTPEFISRNPVRDQFTAFLTTKYGFRPGYDLVRGIFHFLKKDDLYWEWQKSGGATSTMASMDRDYFQDRMGEILQQSPMVNLIKHPIEALRLLGEVTEAGTRLGEFARGIKAEGTAKEGIQQAGFASREVTVDFQRIGANTRSLNSIVAFWNANVQGFDRIARQFVESPGPTTLKTLMAITVPSILLAWANHDDPRYAEIPKWQKDSYWIVMPNRMTREQWDAMSPEQQSAEVNSWGGSVYRIPKPWIEGMLFGSFFERIAEYAWTKDPEAFRQFGLSVWDAAWPQVMPNFALPWFENWSNYSLFFDRRIVPENRKDLPPEFQYAPYTTDAAKKLGQILGKLPWTGVEESLENIASPAKIENLVRGWTGGLGYYALQLASVGMRAGGLVEKGPEKPASTLADIPLIKAFVVRYPQASTESISRFYENYRKSEADWKAVQVLIQGEGRIEKALEVMEGANAVRMGGFKQALDNMHGFIEMVYQNPSMTPQEKRELVDISYLQMVEIARSGNEIYKEVSTSMKSAAEKAPRKVEAEKAPRPAAASPGSIPRFEGGR